MRKSSLKEGLPIEPGLRPRGRRPGSRATSEPRNATFARFGAQSSLKWQSLNSLPNGGYRSPSQDQQKPRRKAELPAFPCRPGRTEHYDSHVVSPTPLTERSAALLRPNRPQERSCLRVRLVRSQQIGRAERSGPLSGSHECVCLFDRPGQGFISACYSIKRTID